MIDQDKLHFIRYGFFEVLKNIREDTPAKWGKMNAQQMTEHLSDFIRISNGKYTMPLMSDPEIMPKLKAFLLSDKPFRENTKAPVLPEEPLPLREASLQDAIETLHKEISDFIQLFTDHPETIATHPVFGELNFEEWILLHYKHLQHHARQFGLIE